MQKDSLAVGDSVAESPAGAGEITGITEAGYPQVNHIAVVWLKRTDGACFDPFDKVGGSCLGTGATCAN